MRNQQKSNGILASSSSINTPKSFTNVVILLIVIGLCPLLILCSEIILQDRISVHLDHLTASQSVVTSRTVELNKSELKSIRHEEIENNAVSILAAVNLFVYLSGGYLLYRLKLQPENLKFSIAQRMRLMVETLPASAVYLHGDRIFMNSAAEEMTGYKRTELTTFDAWLLALYGEKADELKDLYNQSKLLGFPEKGVVHIKTKDNTTKMVEFSVYSDELGEIWIMADRTEQYANEQKFRLLFEQSSDAHLLFDEDGIVDCNLAAMRMMRCDDKSKLVRMNPACLSPIYQPDGLSSEEKGREMVEIALKKGHHRFEWIRLDLEGNTFPVEVSLTVVTLNGKQMLLDVWHDLSDIKAREEELRRSEERFRHSFEDAAIGMTISDMKGDWIQVNQAFSDMLGYTRDELVSTSYSTYTPPEDIELISSWMQNAFSTKDWTPFKKRKRYIHKDGHIVWTFLTIAAAFELNGAPHQLLGQMQDITEQVLAEEELKRKELLLRQAQELAQMGSWEINLTTNETTWSEQLFRLYGYADRISSSAPDGYLYRVSDAERGGVVGMIQLAEESRSPTQLEYSINWPDGSVHFVFAVCRPEFNKYGVIDRIIGTVMDITERKLSESRAERANVWLEDANSNLVKMNQTIEQQLLVVNKQTMELETQKLELELAYQRLEDSNRQLATLASTDGLTGLNNHRSFQEQLRVEFERSLRHNHPLTLLLMDVDKFKQYNDTFGHPAGDYVLKTVASILTKCLRISDFIARYGGEEFVVILPETESKHGSQLAERLRTAIEEHNWEWRGITISVGAVSLGSEILNPAQFIELADKAMYTAKSQGRNKVVIHSRTADIV